MKLVWYLLRKTCGWWMQWPKATRTWRWQRFQREDSNTWTQLFPPWLNWIPMKFSARIWKGFTHTILNPQQFWIEKNWAPRDGWSSERKVFVSCWEKCWAQQQLRNLHIVWHIKSHFWKGDTLEGLAFKKRHLIVRDEKQDLNTTQTWKYERSLNSKFAWLHSTHSSPFRCV